MIKRLAVLLTGLTAITSPVGAQVGLGFGGFAGTLGLGGEAAVGVTDAIVFRGGFGVFPMEPGIDVSGVAVDLKLPSSYHVGVDLYLNSAFRLGGGVLLRNDDPKVKGKLTEPQEIGGIVFQPSEVGTLTGVFDGSDQSPYLLIGFGKHTAPGLGLFVDLGIAFTGEPEVRLGAEGGALSPDEEPLKSALEQEARDVQDDIPSYAKYYPFFSLGVRYGLR
jgi:hypothetical protein